MNSSTGQGSHRPIALVTGVSRKEGLGFEISRQLAAQGMTVVLTARQEEAASANAQILRGEGHDARAMALDVTSDASVKGVVETIGRDLGRLDVLVNNAGGGYNPTERTSTASFNDIRDALALNLEGPWRLTIAALPLLRKSTAARVVNVSSQVASFGDPWGPSGQDGSLPSYTVSKAAQNAMTRKMALDLKPDRVLVNAACPGWAATYPGLGEMGARPVKDGAASIVWCATLPGDGPTGGFFRDGKPLAW